MNLKNTKDIKEFYWIIFPLNNGIKIIKYSTHRFMNSKRIYFICIKIST